VIAEFPDAPLRVIVVWEPVLASDITAPMTSVLGLLPDRRVVQYWDPGRIVSADIVRAVNENPARYGFAEPLPPDFIAWDVVAVFSKSARWNGNLPVPTYYGGPVRDAGDGTRNAIADDLGNR